MKKVNVSIPTYNQSAFLGMAIESALDQNGSMTDLYVSDDASVDDTGEVLSKYDSHPRVNVLRNGKNRGISINASSALLLGEEEYVVRLDSDDLLLPDYCAKLSALLEENPTAAVAHAAVEEIDEFGRHRRIRRLRRATGFQSGEDALRDGIFGYRVAANICMFRRSALEKTGILYRPKLKFCEDWDLFLRLADAGWGNVYCNEVLASYRVWTDAAGYRKGRKLVELTGAKDVYEDALTPAYQVREWSLEPLKAARRRMACGQARALNGIPRDTEDYRCVRKALAELGDCASLRVRCKLIDLGFGWLLDARAWLELRSKDIIKRLLNGFR